MLQYQHPYLANLPFHVMHITFWIFLSSPYWSSQKQENPLGSVQQGIGPAQSLTNTLSWLPFQTMNTWEDPNVCDDLWAGIWELWL